MNVQASNSQTNLTPAQAAMQALWEEPLASEIAAKDTEAALATVVLDPYVNAIPIATGGVGLDQVRELYSKPICLTINPAYGQTPATSTLEHKRNTISPALETLGVLELVRTRCATDGTNVYTEWSGSVYAFVPQQQQQKLFNIIGMNVARCQ